MPRGLHLQSDSQSYLLYTICCFSEEGEDEEH